jgi:hypothetical protein
VGSNDGLALSERNGFGSYQRLVADAIELIIVVDAGGAIAKTALGPKIDFDLCAAVRRLANESSSDAPLIKKERQLELGPVGPKFDWRIRLRGGAGQRRGPENGPESNHCHNQRNRFVHVLFRTRMPRDTGAPMIFTEAQMLQQHRIVQSSFAFDRICPRISVRHQIEVAWIGRTDSLPYDLEGRAHVCCELRDDLCCVHTSSGEGRHPPPIFRATLVWPHPLRMGGDGSSSTTSPACASMGATQTVAVDRDAIRLVARTARLSVYLPGQVERWRGRRVRSERIPSRACWDQQSPGH